MDEKERDTVAKGRDISVQRNIMRIKLMVDWYILVR